MSFHGGFLGVLLAMLLFARKYQKGFWSTMDFVAPLIAPGLLFGRIGNFINGELWGRVTDLPWAWCSARPVMACRAIPRSYMKRRWRVWRCS